MSAAAQSRFAEALRDPAAPAPAGLARRAGADPARRFAVYRNNVMVSLVNAIGTRFPAVARIVGDAFFAELARAYVAAHPPRSPVMSVYGEDFPDFVAGAPGLETLAYLADVARLEAARTRAHHAADAEPLGPEAFAALESGTLDQITIALHPSAEIVRSAHPIVTIWAMNAGEAALGPIEDWTPEDAVVLRPELAVVVQRLPRGGAAFLRALAQGLTLGEAAEAGQADAHDFDLSQNLIGLIGAGLAAALGTQGRRSTP